MRSVAATQYWDVERERVAKTKAEINEAAIKVTANGIREEFPKLRFFMGALKAMWWWILKHYPHSSFGMS